MEKHVYVNDIAAHEGEEVLLRGWLYGRRSSGKLHFLQVRDGTGTIQCVVSKKDVPEPVFAAAEHLQQEASLEVRGKVAKDPRSPLGFELQVTLLHDDSADAAQLVDLSARAEVLAREAAADWSVWLERQLAA